MSLEAMIREAAEVLRARNHQVTYVTDAAVIDADADGDGKLDPNPDPGAGSEPGRIVLTVDATDFLEDRFAGAAGIEEIVARVESSLGRTPA